MSTFWVFVVAIISAALLAACGSTNQGAGESTTASRGAVSTSQSSTASAFPVTVEHLYGTTEVTTAPQRVVALGYSDADALLAVGVRPIGVVNWFEVPPENHKWSWQQKAFGDVTPQVVGTREEYDMEKIVALKPDLVIAAYSGMSKQQYDTISKFTKVVAQPKGHEPFAAPWQDLTMQVTKAVGHEQRGKALITGVEKKISDARASNPQWSGQTAMTAAYGGGQYFGFTRGDPKTDLLVELGFTVPAEVNALGKQGTAQISPERVRLLDADKLVWMVSSPAGEAEVKGRPEYAALPVAKEKRVLFLVTSDRERPIAAAFSYNSVLSLPYVVDQLVPDLKALPEKS